MQLRLKLAVVNELELPINYNYYIQSLIYNLLSDSVSLSQKVHDSGYVSDSRRFKLFTFSSLVGKYKIHQKKISFYDEVELEIRTIDDSIFAQLVSSLTAKKAISLGRHVLKIKSIVINYTQLTEDHYHIKMLSPIIVRSTPVGSNTSIFYNPLENAFVTKLNDNCRRKYRAYFNEEMLSDISIKPINFSLKNKVVTSYKDYLLTGWRGEYSIRGDANVLDFLYQVGLGEKNSMGFGAFKIMNKGEYHGRSI